MHAQYFEHKTYQKEVSIAYSGKLGERRATDLFFNLTEN